jgi:integrase
MATIRKRGAKWQVQIKKNGERRSETFTTKAAATSWATAQEHEIENIKLGALPNKTFGDILKRYSTDVAAKKPGAEWEIKRIKMFLRDKKLCDVAVSRLDSTIVSEWRDRRLQSVIENSVRREWAILAHACVVAIKEWKWLKVNPFTDVTRPEQNEARTQMFTPDQIERLVYSSGYEYDAPPLTVTARVGAIFLMALETAARSGELVNLTWTHVHPNYIHFPKTKNGTKRDVPLSAEAKRIIEQLRGVKGCEKSVFGMNHTQRDALFRKLKTRCQIEDMHFHDSRRNALTRLSKIFNVMELARISGHLDLRILMSVYYAPDVEDLAANC